MIIYFVRHGQTDFNKNHRLQGRVFDEPLNSDGVREINDILPNLPKDFEVIYSSPHKRVIESAKIISNYSDKPIMVSKNIEERDFGSLDGKTWNDIPGGRELREIDINQKYDYHQYGGDSVGDVSKRLKQFFDEVRTSGHNIVLAVSSVGIIRLAHKILLNEIVTDINTASVHKFEI